MCNVFSYIYCNYLLMIIQVSYDIDVVMVIQVHHRHHYYGGGLLVKGVYHVIM